MLLSIVVLKQGRQGEESRMCRYYHHHPRNWHPMELPPWQKLRRRHGTYRLTKLFGRTTDEALSQGNMAAHVDGWGKRKFGCSYCCWPPNTYQKEILEFSISVLIGLGGYKAAMCNNRLRSRWKDAGVKPANTQHTHKHTHTYFNAKYQKLSGSFSFTGACVFKEYLQS